MDYSGHPVQQPKQISSQSWSMKRKQDAFTKKARKIILAAIAEGNHYETAASLAGIPSATLRNWVDQGRAGDPIYHDFVVDLERAEAESEQLALRIVREAATGLVSRRTITKNGDEKEGKKSVLNEEMFSKDWKAAAFLLSTRWGDRWGQLRKLQFSGQLNQRNHVIIHASPEDFMRVVQADDGSLQVEDKKGNRSPIEPPPTWEEKKLLRDPHAQGPASSSTPEDREAGS